MPLEATRRRASPLPSRPRNASNCCEHASACTPAAGSWMNAFAEAQEKSETDENIRSVPSPRVATRRGGQERRSGRRDRIGNAGPTRQNIGADGSGCGALSQDVSLGRRDSCLPTDSRKPMCVFCRIISKRISSLHMELGQVDEFLGCGEGTHRRRAGKPRIVSFLRDAVFPRRT